MRSDNQPCKQDTSGRDSFIPLGGELDTLKRKLRSAQESQTLAVKVLELLSRKIGGSDAIREILDMVKEFTGFEAVGIRLRDGEDFPYFETKGFPGHFVEAENSLCSRTPAGEIIRDVAGNPLLECMCGNIICGRTDPSLPFFTPGGSFWSNCTTELLATTTVEERQTRTRNRCNGEGYESVALIPLRSGDETIGLLQLNDSRKNCFTPEMIGFFEGVGVSIGIVLERTRKEQERDRLFELSIDMLFIAGFDGFFKQVNPAFTKTLGWTKEELLSRPWIDLVHSEDRPEALEAAATLVSGEPLHQFRNRCRHIDGSYRWLSWNIFAIPGERLFYAVGRDVTRQKEFEEALSNAKDELEKRVEERTAAWKEANEKLVFEISERKRAEVFLNTVVDNLPIAVFAKSARDGQFILWNKAGEALFGFTKEQVIGKTDYDFFPKAQADFFWEKDSESFASGQIVDIPEEPILTKNLGARLLHTMKVPIYDKESNPSYLLGISQDITERKAAEDSLRQLSSFQQILMDAIPNPVFYKDVRGRYLGCNEAFTALVGRLKEEVVGRSVYEVVPGELAEIWHEKDQELFRLPHVQSYEHNFKAADGAERFFINRKAPFFAVDGSLAGLIGVMVDITEHKRAEQALRESEARVRLKLDSILSPEGDVGTLGLADVIDIQTIQALMDDFFSLTKIPVGMIDLEGKVLVATGWQDICTKFHRVHPETCGHCVESDTLLSRGVEPGSFKLYRCKNNLWDMATPIMVGGKHLGNLFLGQFLFEGESPDYDAFRSQARRYGFDEQQYLAALDRAPRWSRETVDTAMNFYSKLADILSTVSYSNIKLARSIAERERLLDSLKVSEERYRSLFENMLEGFGYHKMLFEDGKPQDYVFLNANDSFERLTGLKNVIGKKVTDVIPGIKESNPELFEIYGRVALTGQPEKFETYVESLGSWFSVSVYSPEREHFVSVFDNITEHKRAQEALRASEEKYRASFNNAAVGIDLVDRHGRFVEVNDTLSNFFGYTGEELRNLSILDVTYPEDSTRSREKYEELIQGKTERYRLEKRYLRKDGTVVWADTSVSAIRDREGKYRATVGVIVDITKRKESEETARRLATAVEQAAEAIVITDTEGTILYVNPAFELITGYSREEATGKNPRILKSGQHDARFYSNMWETLNSGRAWSGHLINEKKDGTVFEEEATISPITDESGLTIGYVGVKRDVTKEVSLQRQLHEAQKMEAIGTLAGGIAHDFNNLLQITLGYSELLLSQKADDEAEYGDLHKIHQAALSGADLVQRLLTFSRKVEPKPVPMSLNKQIRQVEKLLRRTILKMIDIRLELGDDDQRINADPALVEQALMNLAVNARDAMPDGGVLTVRTRNISLDEDYCRLHPEWKRGDYVLLSVSDTGQGMDEATLEHIFEPFYTTKELGRGTGLGLAMVYGIVKQHGGYISCESTLGQGTTFKIYLPVIHTEAMPDILPDELDLPRGTEIILLVDDEEIIRELGQRILRRSGYTVLTAPNGKEALNVYQKEKGNISLVILDLIMPEMGGKLCLEELLKIDPQLKVIIASGYAADGQTKETVEKGAKGFIAKPYNLKEMLQTVRHVLDQN